MYQAIKKSFLHSQKIILFWNQQDKKNVLLLTGFPTCHYVYEYTVQGKFFEERKVGRLDSKENVSLKGTIKDMTPFLFISK